jgi:hypothetical protein
VVELAIDGNVDVEWASAIFFYVIVFDDNLLSEVLGDSHSATIRKEWTEKRFGKEFGNGKSPYT